MLLHGSCQCQRVKFSVRSSEYVPFMQCYCSLCRKTGGGGGYAINLGADFRTLRIEGKDHIKSYHARMEKDGEVSESSAERSFCGHCGSALWLYDSRWPELVHPLASAIDTPLPKAPEGVRLMLGSRAPWVHLPAGDASGMKYEDFDEYPRESLRDWHQRHSFPAE